MTQTSEQTRLDQFYSDLETYDLKPLWPIAMELMPPEPKPRTLPWLWRWKTLRDLAERAGELIAIDRGGDRRVLSLANPGLGGLPYATSTLWGAVQFLNPREHAAAHRHTPGAIRFVLEGDGVYTTVNGDACDMHPGDLVLTPGWTWHDHNSSSDRPMIWFDGLDMPTVNALDAIFFEQYPDEMLQPVVARNRSERQFPAKGLLPASAHAQPGPSHSPLLVYRWADTDAALEALLEEGGGPIARCEFTDPTNGRPVLPTLACEMHRMVPGERTVPTRRVGSSVLVAYRGAGATVINGTRFEWGRGDMLAVPSWALVDHEASEPSDLFAISDTPVLQALGLYREVTLDVPQEVTATFPG
ncbi:MAG TPA: cupin domain-containing protein [Actinomycetes bacterium]|nr:cupin domain-containing protein [Actinomycetes bacterium]